MDDKNTLYGLDYVLEEIVEEHQFLQISFDPRIYEINNFKIKYYPLNLYGYLNDDVLFHFRERLFEVDFTLLSPELLIDKEISNEYPQIKKISRITRNDCHDIMTFKMEHDESYQLLRELVEYFKQQD
ncbi:MAG: hypothetical protein ABH824_06020 [Nanoarchaeota archaeon]|nr:hypothetical protein [Nanoarchaeota archaeon]MBU1632582.1 hypothetical protein [Nanoarchaeota archaeon]MBU1875792.1 hypothetical protein [Nanoarchaeota archaeon]